MDRTTFNLAGADGTELAAYRWPAVDARGIVALAHGMGEHALRYERLARALTGAGFDVVAVDHRGHGASARREEDLGKLGPGGWGAVVDDFAHLVRQASAARPGVPVVVLGHSLGSWIVQTYLLEHARSVAAAVLSGSAALDELSVLIDPSAELDLTAMNAPFQPARTDFDWLSRDAAEVDKYVADARCGFGLDPASLESWLGMAGRLANPAALAQIPDGFPVYILSGAQDVANNGLAWVETLAERYRQAGVDVTTHYYEDARHELFNETNRDEVVADLLGWLKGLPALSAQTAGAR